MIEQSATRALDAPHAQLGIDHRRVVGAHPAGAGRMKNRRAVLARKRQQVGLESTAGPGVTSADI